MFSKKATNIDEIFTVDLTLRSKYQSDGEDFIIFFGLLRKHELKRILKIQMNIVKLYCSAEKLQFPYKLCVNEKRTESQQLKIPII